jgi:hypothetical protein
MSQLSREDLKVLIDKYVSKNGNLKNNGTNVNILFKLLVDSFFNLLDDVGSGGQVNSDWNATSGVAQILNKPSTFPPEAHTHSISAISGLQTALDNKLEILSIVNDLITGGVAVPLSAQQGVVLKGLVDQKADKLTTANTIKGRLSTNGDVQDLTSAQVTALLDLFSNTLKGLVPASGGGTVNFLRADQTFANPLPTVTEVGATNTITTTSTTHVLMTSMTLSPAAGTYLVMFSGTGYNNGTPGGFIECSLYVNGTIVTTSVRRNTNGGNTNASSLEGVIAFQEKVTITAGQVIEVRWRVNGATGTMIQRKLTLMSCQ